LPSVEPKQRLSRLPKNSAPADGAEFLAFHWQDVPLVSHCDAPTRRSGAPVSYSDMVHPEWVRDIQDGQ